MSFTTELRVTYSMTHCTNIPMYILSSNNTRLGLLRLTPIFAKKKILTQVGLFESQLHINYILHLQNSNLQTFSSLLKWKIMPPSFRPILMPLSKFLASTKMVGTQNAERSTSQRTWAWELLDPTQLPSWPLGTSAAPKKFLFTPASYSHSTRTLLSSICFISSFFFQDFLKVLQRHIKAPK